MTAVCMCLYRLRCHQSLVSPTAPSSPTCGEWPWRMLPLPTATSVWRLLATVGCPSCPCQPTSICQFCCMPEDQSKPAMVCKPRIDTKAGDAACQELLQTLPLSIASKRCLLALQAHLLQPCYPAGAFGNGVASNIMLSVERPHWLVAVANLLVVIHVFGSYQVCTTLPAWMAFIVSTFTDLHNT